MAQDLEQLVLSISADTRQIQRALRRLEGDTNASTRKIERQFDSLGRSVGRSFDGLGRSLRGSLAGLVGAFSLREAQGLIDSATRIQNALKVAGLAGDELTRVYDRLFDSAQRNAAPLESLVTLYGRAAIVQRELGVSTEELLSFTDNVALALRVAGTDAQSASGALLQLSQALGSGVVRAEEFNSILEGALPIAQAAAAGLKEAGGSVAELRKLVVDGKVSSEAFFRAFEAGSVVLREKVAGAELTVSQAFVRLQNVLIDVATRFDDQTDASGILANSIEKRLIPAIEELGKILGWATDGPFGDFYNLLGDIIERTIQLSADLGAATGLDEVGRRLGAKPYIGPRRIQERIAGAFPGERPTAGAPSVVGTGEITHVMPTEIAATKPNSTVKPISISDYAVDGSEKTKKGRKERADEYERLTKRIAESTTELVAETEAQRQLNPLVEDYGYAAEKARLERELLTAAQEAGRQVTPQLRAEIAALADQYATAGAESARLAETQDELRQAFEDTRALGRDILGGFVDDIRRGVDASEMLANALGKVADRLLDVGFDQLFGKSGKAGLLDGLFSSLLPGRAAGGPVRAGQPYIVGEKRPEVFVPDSAGTILPSVPSAAQMARAGSATSFAPVYNIDARGADAAAVARLERSLARRDAEMESRIVTTVRRMQNGEWR